MVPPFMCLRSVSGDLHTPLGCGDDLLAERSDRLPVRNGALLDGGPVGEQPEVVRFGIELRQLYEAAGSPDLASLIRQGRNQVPSIVFHDATLSDWFNGRTVPSDPLKLRFLIQLLEGRAKRRSGYGSRGPIWWEELRGAAVAQKRGQRGGRPRTRPVAERDDAHAPRSVASVQRPIMRSAYLYQVRRIAPRKLTGRHAELAELAAFCTAPGKTAYRWWRAPAWAGKSALMSWFVLNPPPGIRLVSFFITARLSGQGDRLAFVEAVLEQLAELIGVPVPTYLTDVNREAHLLALVDQAAEACQQDGQRLVLLVDGLDEDLSWTSSPEAHSIAAMLPPYPAAGMRIIVAGRSDPPLPADVPADHPLRDPAVVRPLSPSPHAQVVQHEAQRELKRLLHGTLAEQQLLGLLTAAGGGLSGPDLAELAGVGLQEIEDILHAVTGRTFRARVGRWRSDTAIYLLGHEELQQTASSYLGSARLYGHRQQLHEWADQYRDGGWPPQTPEYLVRSYYRLLQSTGDTTRMIALATDSARHDRMFEITGGDRTALSEVVRAQEAILADDGADLAVMARLAVRREALRQRNSNVPGHLATVWARLGHLRRAEALAQSVTEPAEQAGALASVALIAVKAGDLDYAEHLASSITAPNEQINVLARMAIAAADAGDVDRARRATEQAQALAELITKPWLQIRAWITLAQAAMQLNDRAGFAAFADRAETLARSLTHPFPQMQELSLTAEVMARVGELDRAERLADLILEPHERTLLLTRIAKAAADLGNAGRARSFIDQAQALSADVADPRARGHVLAVIASTAAEFDNAEHTYARSMKAATAARTLVNPEEQIPILTWTADAFMQAGHLDHATALFDEAESLAMSIEEENSRSSALMTVASALATGDIDRAEEIIEQIGSAKAKQRALRDLAQAAALAGDVARAEALARSIQEPYMRVQMLALVAGEMVLTGDLDAATALANEIETVARAIVNAESRAESLTALTTAMTEANDLDRATICATQAEAHARLIDWHVTRTFVLATLARAMVRIGAHDRAILLAESIEEQHECAKLTSVVATELIRSGHCDRAEKLTLSLPAAHLIVETLTVLAKELASAGEHLDRACRLVRKAEALLHTIERPHQLAKAQSSVASGLAHIGELDNAQTLALAIQVPSAKVSALVAVAEGLARAGSTPHAVSVLVHAENAAGSIKEAHLLVRASAHIAPALIEAGARERLGPLIDRAEAAARTVPKQMQAQLLAVVALMAAQAGDLQRAEDLARTDTDLSWQSHARTLAEVTETMVLTGDPDRAERLLSSISTTWLPSIQVRLVKALCTTADTGRAEHFARSITNPDLQAEALATIAGFVDHARARQFVAQALHVGCWAKAVGILAQIEPEVATALADDVTSAGRQNLTSDSLVSGVAYRPILKLDG